MSTINESTLAELLFPHVMDDPITFHRLAQVSTRFNKVAKSKLIKKVDSCPIFKTTWTEFQSNGMKHGAYKIEYTNGRIQLRQQFYNGKTHGLYQTWAANGQLICETNYNKGNIHGLYRTWSLTGQLETEFNFKNNLHHGIQRTWNPDGTLFLIVCSKMVLKLKI